MDVWKTARLWAVCCGVTMSAAFAQHGSSNTVNPYTTPEHAASGAALFRKQCAGCHGLEGAGAGAGPALNSGRFQRGGSDEALFQTISKGVAGTTMPAFAFTGLQTWQLVTHLRTLSAAKNLAVSGDRASGEVLFNARCRGCHRAGTEGGFGGPSLAGIGARQSLADLRQSILEPDSQVSPEYWTVQIQTAGGAQRTGTRLNEDTGSIQIRDKQGRLQSILKSEISRMELIRTSPMPSFNGKLTAREIDDILAFVVSLPGEEQ